MSNSPRIGFNRHHSNTVMTEMPFPMPETDQIAIEALESIHADKNVRLLVRQSVTDHLLREVAWNSRPNPSDEEKAGLLVGHYHQFSTPSGKIIWGDVQAIIPFDQHLVYSTNTSIIITQDAWKKMLVEYVPFKNDGLVMLGWYHTHLGPVPPRFSKIDKDNQQKNFTGKYCFAAILNPNQRKWSVAYGPDGKECRGVILTSQEMLERFRNPKITVYGVNGDIEQSRDGRIDRRTPNGSHGRMPQSMMFPERNPSIKQHIGSLLIRIGNRLVPDTSYDPTPSPRRRPGQGINTDSNQQDSFPPSSPNTSQIRFQRESNSSRITIQRTEKPKISIINQNESDPSRKILQATVAVIGSEDLSNWKVQSEDELQIIESNIIQVVDAILSKNSGSSFSLSNSIRAVTKINNDLTLEISFCDENCLHTNTEIRVCRTTVRDAFPERIMASHVDRVAGILDQSDDRVLYLVYLGKTENGIDVMVLCIERR